MQATRLIAAAAALALGAVAAQRAETNGESEQQPALLVASGDAEVSARPEIAVLRLGAEAQAAAATAAQQQVNQAMQQAIAAIREAGIPAEDIQTASISLQPVYSNPRPQRQDGAPEEPRLVAWRASNTVRVEVAELARVGDVIDRGVAAGANQLSGLSFELRDDTPQRIEALRRAVAAARQKASALAEAAGVRLVAIERIEEGGVQTVARRARMEAASFQAGTPVEPGQVRVSASVTITWRIAEGGG